MEETYYKNIVYKKNAFEDLKTHIKLNYLNKKILLVSTKSIPAEDVTKVLNSLICGSENVSHFVARENFSQKELNLLGEKVLKDEFNLMVAFGGGKCTDVVKYFAFQYNIDYISCPTMATSLAYFLDFCINPYDASKSFYAKAPNKIYIQESIIKNASCYTNICGLSFLHSLRAVVMEGIASDVEKERYIFVGMEKLFEKLDDEQVDILLCSDDSNLVLMDLFIDFGFFMSMLKLEDYYLFNMYMIFRTIKAGEKELAGKNMLACSKAILFSLAKFLELNCTDVLEKNNYEKISFFIEKNKISYNLLKNNKFFNIFLQKMQKNQKFISKKEQIYKNLCSHLYAIGAFGKQVKSVYKYGLEVDGSGDDVYKSLLIAPYVYNCGDLINYMAGSGVLNAFAS